MAHHIHPFSRLERTAATSHATTRIGVTMTATTRTVKTIPAATDHTARRPASESGSFPMSKAYATRTMEA